MKILITGLALLILLAGGAVAFISLDNEEIVENESAPEEQETDVVAEEEAPAAPTEPVPLPDVELTDEIVTFETGKEVTFSVAEPFDMTIAAAELGKVRFMTMSPDGRLFVPDLVDYLLSREGRIIILEDFNEETKQFETTHTYLSGLRGPNSVAFYTDESGDDWIYIALTAHLVRYPYEAGDTEPSGEPEIVFEFPNTQSEEAKSVVWHITRTINFHEGRVYISVGSGCNACEQEPGEMRGMVFSMNPDGTDARVYADGLRNAVGITWAGDTLYATENGADHLGINAPDERLYELVEGEHYGWPYCYERDGERVLDDSVAWENPIDCEEVPPSLAAFPPRSAPLGLAYFAEAHPMLEGSFLVALHGSFDATVKRGYQLVRVSKDGDAQVFMDGFQSEDGERLLRPVDILQIDENSFFMTDDYGGRVYYVSASE